MLVAALMDPDIETLLACYRIGLAEIGKQKLGCRNREVLHRVSADGVGVKFPFLQ